MLSIFCSPMSRDHSPFRGEAMLSSSFQTANRVHATHILKKNINRKKTGNRSLGFTPTLPPVLIFRAFKDNHPFASFFSLLSLDWLKNCNCFLEYMKSCWLKTPNITLNIDKILLKLCANNDIGNTQHDTVGFGLFFPLRQGE